MPEAALRTRRRRWWQLPTISFCCTGDSRRRRRREAAPPKSVSVRCHRAPPANAVPYTAALPGIDGLVVMKHIFGIRVRGTRIRIRKGSKFTWVSYPFSFGFSFFLSFVGKRMCLFSTGAYDDEEAAARAYDLAALKYWGPGTLINFPVTDYTRDLDEMQNVSREEYLASLRRKSSGFSRGISKYRALSSRWEPYGRIAGSDYFNSMQYGDDSAAESDYMSGFCIERKIDLTSHIKWWASNKNRQPDSGTRLSEEKKHGFAGDVCSELKTLEQKVQPTEPYQMPKLGQPHNEKKHKSSSGSALSILSQSAAYKSLQEKAAKRQENSTENDENENKNIVNKLDHGKAVEKSSNHEDGNDRLDIAMGMSGALSLQRNVYPLTPFLSAPLLTAYNSVDPLGDPVLWTSIVPILPAGMISRTAEVTKTETSSTYTMFQPEE
ncbi:AP2-like ethylene-responsive transcription factor [Arachis hypogaea]|nr:AP2-like ethylene-responsive transcription factor [Arachis hypogaea]